MLELLPSNPVVTGSLATELLGSSAPTARKAIEVLRKTGVLHETSGRRRDRVSMYEAYLRELAADDASAWGRFAGANWTGDEERPSCRANCDTTERAPEPIRLAAPLAAT